MWICLASAKCPSSRSRKLSRMSATPTWSRMGSNTCRRRSASHRSGATMPMAACARYFRRAWAKPASACRSTSESATPSRPRPNGSSIRAMLDLPRPRLRAYRPETAIAEKLHAMVVLGEANSRMRDFFDVHALAQHRRFDGALLARAVRATFERRRTRLPESLPLALTPEFAAIRDKQVQWQGFLRKSALTSPPAELGTIVARIATFLEPAITAARSDVRLKLAWPPGGPWKLAS